MKSLSFKEFNSYLLWISSLLEGAQLQNIWTGDEVLVLEFYKYKNYWLFYSLENKEPQLTLIQKELPAFKKKIKPLALFLSSHAKNLRLESVKSVPEYGRVGLLELKNSEKKCSIEFQLVPGHPNIIVTLGEKKMSWSKPIDLPRMPNPDTQFVSGMEEQWLNREDELNEKFNLRSHNLEKGLDKNHSLQKALSKKQSALLAMQSSLEKVTAAPWSELGSILKNHQEIPDHLKNIYQDKMSRSEQIEYCFAKAKSIEKKRIGTLDRIEVLKNEIEKLKDILSHPEKQNLINDKPSQASALMKKADAKARKIILAEGVEAVCGRSAKDNLAILRQARAWDLWLHLKDYPGAHGIIFRNKNKNVTSEQFQQVAEWVIRESSAAKGFRWGAKYEVIVAECRYVKPIKGDKIGRVTFTHPQVFTFSSSRALTQA